MLLISDDNSYNSHSLGNINLNIKSTFITHTSCPFNTLNDAYHHGGGGRVGYPHGEEHGGQHEPQHQHPGARP